ncbi:MAG: hypothetical protein HGA43_04060 [Nitrospirae bacterium]|nr:hypothetical protein [Nitrospirota bacterium]
MKIITWFKRKLTGRHEAMTRELAERIKRLPKDQARRELGSFLFELAVRHATEFVKDDLRRTDPPFKGVPPEAVFHELLAVTFWIMDNEIAGGSKALTAELHDHYVRTYRNVVGSPEERGRALGEKYKQYECEWDDVMGHQDEFGQCVAQNLFGAEPSMRTRERSFWVIRYAHDVADDCAPLKKMFRAKFKPDTQAAAGV